MLFVKQVSIQSFEAIEQAIRSGHKKPEDLLVTWGKLHEDFKGENARVDSLYRWTYFRLYTELSWKLYAELDRDTFVKIVIGRQIAMAFTLDFDVWKTIMWYLASRSLDDKDMAVLYADIRQAFFESEAFVGVWQGKDVLVKDLITDIKRTKLSTTTSLEVAEVMGKIKDTFFAKNDEGAMRFSIAEDKELIEQLVGLYDFFTEREPSSIWATVQAYTNPSMADAIDAYIEEGAVQYKRALAGKVVGEGPSSAVTEPVPAPQTAPKTEAKPAVKPSVAAAPTPKPTYLDIQLVAQSKFKQSEDGQFEDPEAVLGMLEEWAVKYNDDTIRELYVYNEQTGAFEWNEALLK
jgi:hypothetical protein